jgi:thiol-disulfide isomerase/thioredoxin
MPTRRTASALIAGALSAVVIATSASGCATSGASATGDANYVAGDGSVTLVKAPDRQAAPDLSGSLVGGGHRDLDEFAGQVVVLNVWASWCGPCRKESAELVEAARRLPGVAFLGINTRDNEGNAEAFVRAQHIPYPSFSDQDGSLVLDMQHVLPMSSLPITVILDRQHRVAAAIYGPTSAVTIEDIAKPLERRT